MRTTTLAPEEARAHTQAGRKIEYLSIAWTTLEAVAGIIAGVLAGSVVIIGFGVDSAIEVASSVVLLWRLSDHAHAEEREKLAHRLVGVGFLALAAYISFNALHDLITHEPPRVRLLWYCLRRCLHCRHAIARTRQAPCCGRPRQRCASR
jgi:divalent metal cation (Fe/Co/Zn/Cd) transporter